MTQNLPIKISVVGLYRDLQVSPYTNLSYTEIFRNFGFTICEPYQSPKVIVCVDYLDSSDFAYSGDSTALKVLIRNEPAVVLPSSYSHKAHQIFDEIITVGSTLEFPWPQSFPDKFADNFRESRTSDSQVFINSNKLSFVAGELYSLRMEVISGVKSVDTYGKDWDRSTFWKVKQILIHLRRALSAKCKLTFRALRFIWKRPLNSKGSPLDKLAVYKNYKVAIVIENSETYLSEKLFDSFFGGCIPVYVGPQVKPFGIPEDLVIQVGATLSEIKHGISVAQSLDYDAWKSKLDSWLSKLEVRNLWAADNVYNRLAMRIEDLATN